MKNKNKKLYDVSCYLTYLFNQVSIFFFFKKKYHLKQKN
jgi:hypothetical protein